MPEAALSSSSPAAPPAATAQSERVLLLTPTGRDAELLGDQLARRGLAVTACADVHALCREIEAGAGVTFVAEEALSDAALECLIDSLRHQPPWSDLPVIVMTAEGEQTPRDKRLEGLLLGATGNVTLLQRPIRLVTLFSVIQSALKSRRRQYQVRRLLDDSRRAVEQRDQFLAMLGHELRNPLAAIVSSVAVLTEVRDSGFADDPSEQHAIINRQSQHMARLVDDLLDVARITSGKITLKLQPLDLRDVVTRSLQSLKLACGGRERHRISCDLPPRPVPVHGDFVRLEQVLGNLLTNAVKYTPEHGEIRVSMRADADEAIVSVRDTGDGVPADMLDRIFEPFAQVKQSLARSRGGLGMGLAVVKSLVEMHGGRVTARSDGPGAGTEFIVRVPTAADGVAQQVEAAAAPGPRVRQSRRVLLVEDNADSRRSLARLLELYGHDVDTADDGPAGLEKALAARPEAVLLDIGLPGLDGYEVGRRIRESLGRDVLLVALTGYGQPEDRDRVLDAGFDVHLVKPVDANRLHKVLIDHAAGSEVGRGQ